MKRHLLLGLFSILASLPPASFAEDWRKIAAATPWSWPVLERRLIDCLAYRPEDAYLVTVEEKPYPNGRRSYGEPFDVVVKKDSQERFRFPAHPGTVFIIQDDVLIYADFILNATGCRLVAFDLTLGRQVWDQPLVGVGPVAHSRYSNSVQIEIVDNVLRVWGRESAGRYMELVDLKTGKELIRRLY